jgi:glycosyltransferase involved in cell wall biosynthesis
VRVAVVAEFYPHAHDPVLGIWAHRQAIAARDAGADVKVLVLHRRVPARAEPHKLRALAQLYRQPRRAELDGIEIEYVPYYSPARERTYGTWARYAAPALTKTLRRWHKAWPIDLLHAHNAIPAGDATGAWGRTRKAIGDGGAPPVPLVVSVHGGDVYFTAKRFGEERVRAVLETAAVVLANSEGVLFEARGLGARDARVVHLGTDVPDPEPEHEPNTIVTVAHLDPRKRHEDVIRALPELAGWRYVVIGDGPERARLAALAADLGVDVEFTGQLAPDAALERARRCAVFAMPSTDEAFGVAYVEAMAGGLPAIGRAGEPGPEEIAGLGPGMHLIHRTEDLPTAILTATNGAAARATAAAHFSWEACGRATVQAYQDALR